MDCGILQQTVVKSAQPWEYAETRELYTSGLPWCWDGKESACDAGDLGSVPGLGRPPGKRNGYPLQCSCLENLMDREKCLRFQAMGSQRVRHDSTTNTLTFHGSVLKEDSMYYVLAHGRYAINVLQRTWSVVVFNEKKILTWKYIHVCVYTHTHTHIYKTLFITSVSIIILTISPVKIIQTLVVSLCWSRPWHRLSWTIAHIPVQLLRNQSYAWF